MPNSAEWPKRRQKDAVSGEDAHFPGAAISFASDPIGRYTYGC
jgi:hypothetical protein